MIQTFSTEQELRDRIAELETANGMLADFAALVSHDLQSALRCVTNFAELLALLPALTANPHTSAFSHTIIGSVRRLQSLTHEALASPTQTHGITAEPPRAAHPQHTRHVLEIRLRALQHDNRELSDFANSVARDLRTPLGQILDAAGHLTTLPVITSNPLAIDMAWRILVGGKQMQHLIDDYLSFAHAERHHIQRSRVSLESLVQLVRHELESLSAGRKVGWQIAPLPEVEADASMLRQVIFNLLSNSLKYTRKCPEAVIEIGVRPAPDELIIFIRDNGVGFDLGSARNLFQKFGRLHGDATFPGVGVGLLAVKYIIEHHHGRVWAEAIPEGGATFCFTLPAAHNAPAASTVV
jgi:light-regulated signal transduction histidine kinase (bacteriophytochrome)